MSEVAFDRERGTLTLGGSRIVFHCHHYNVFLQRSVDGFLDIGLPGREDDDD